jgi:hypothetical protein
MARKIGDKGNRDTQPPRVDRDTTASTVTLLYVNYCTKCGAWEIVPYRKLLSRLSGCSLRCLENVQFYFTSSE